MVVAAALAYLVIMTNVTSSGRAMMAMPFPTLAACTREAKRFNDAVASIPSVSQLVRAFCIDASPE